MTTRAARRRRACARLVGVAPARRLAPRIPTTSADVSGRRSWASVGAGERDGAVVRPSILLNRHIHPARPGSGRPVSSPTWAPAYKLQLHSANQIIWLY